MAKKKKPDGFKDDKSSKDFKDGKNKKGGRPNNFKKDDTKGSDTGKESKAANAVSSSPDDPTLFMRGGNYSVDTANISTLQPIGWKGPAIVTGQQNYTPAGIARYDYIPYFGNIVSASHPMNVAAKLLYDVVNSQNSRSSAYDPADLMQYCIAVANAWVLHATVKRIVGIFPTFSGLNRYWQAPLIQSMGVSPQSVEHDVTEWRNLANRMAIVLNTLRVPNNITYFQRAIRIPAKIYADSTSEKASLWYYLPYALFKWSYNSDGIAELYLSRTPFATETNITPARVEAYFNELTADLFNDSDIRHMGGDILKAFGPENMFMLPQIDYTYMTKFDYDPLANLCLHNSRVFTVLKQAAGQSTYKLSQDVAGGNILKASWAPTVDANTTSPDVAFMYFNQFATDAQIPLDFPTDDVNPALVVAATRMLPFFNYPNRTPQACSEAIVQDRFFSFVNGETLDSWELVQLTTAINSGVPYQITQPKFEELLTKLDYISKFTDRPISYIIAKSESNGYMIPSMMRMISDTTNYTTISNAELARMNDACQLSLFITRPMD